MTGTNEVRATLSHDVTRDDLRDIFAAQSAEMKTYVRSKAEPLQDGLAQVSDDVQSVGAVTVEHANRIDGIASLKDSLRSTGFSSATKTISRDIDLSHLRESF